MEKGYIDHIFLASALIASEFSASRFFCFNLGTHYISCVDSGVGLDNMEKCKFFTLPGFEQRPLGPIYIAIQTVLLRHSPSVIRQK
jgi:hypothetical protein